MSSKIGVNFKVVDAVAGPVSEIVDITKHEDFSIQVDYGPNAGGDMILEASLDGTSFSPITGSTQAMDVGGDTHVWNVTDLHCKYIRIGIPVAASPTTVRFQGSVDFD